MNSNLNAEFKSTVTNEGHARAHDPGSAIVRVRMNLDLGTFAPQIIRSAWPEKIRVNAHAHQPKKIRIDTIDKNSEDTLHVYLCHWYTYN